MQLLGEFFGFFLDLCYRILSDYGWAIILFTLITKIIMLPVSIIVQLNSIKMVRLYPDLNRIKAKYLGNKDMISEEQYKLYQREKYHPILDLVSVLVQLVLLMGVVEGIYSLIERGNEMVWFGINLGAVPSQAMGITLIIPIVAALSAFAMCATQNASNVLQSEQGFANKAITLTISVGLSLYLGLFVPAGVGLYWIASNLMSIALMYILNAWFDPKKYIDYDALEQSREELKKATELMDAVKQEKSAEEKVKEKADYKRFLKYGPMQLVFYSEKNGFYKYFKGVIEVILKKTDIDIHYITSDYNDAVFQIENEHFHTYYIGENRLIVLMMKIDADMVVMTTPDLQKYHIKKSMIRDDVEYVYIDHGIGSINLMLRPHALDAFDTVFASNDVAKRELLAQEKTYGLKPRRIIDYGYDLIDNMIASYEASQNSKISNNSKPMILIAPSWQDDNILDICADELIGSLLGHDYRVIVRPHPQYVRHCEGKLLALKDRFSSNADFELQMDFSSNSTVYDADVMVTDWSSIAYEYTFTTLKPVLYINTPMKVMNPDYEEIGVVPMDIEVRDKLGKSLNLTEVAKAADAVEELLHNKEFDRESLEKLRNEYMFNVGSSAQVGAKYIINRLIERSKE